MSEGMRALAKLVQHLARDTRDGSSALLPPGVLDALPDELVRRHFLAPLAWRAGAERFRKDGIASALLAEIRAATLREATRALGHERVPVMLFKGISYVDTIYQDPAERPMSDIDLLVPTERFADAARVLRGLGYWNAGPARQLSPLHHAMTFKRKNAALDLHRSVMQPLRSRIDIADIWRRAIPAADQPGVLRPAPVDEALLHLAHMARHELSVPAINYIDAARLMRRVRDAGAPGHDDTEAVFAKRVRAYRLSVGIGAALRMTALVTRAEVGAGLLHRPVWRAALCDHLLPSRAQVLAGQMPARPRQILAKLSLVDGPFELAGLLAVALHGRLLARQPM